MANDINFNSTKYSNMILRSNVFDLKILQLCSHIIMTKWKVWRLYSTFVKSEHHVYITTILECEWCLLTASYCKQKNKAKCSLNIVHTFTWQQTCWANLFFWFGLVLYVPINNYGHVGTASSPSFSWASLNKQ